MKISDLSHITSNFIRMAQKDGFNSHTGDKIVLCQYGPVSTMTFGSLIDPNSSEVSLSFDYPSSLPENETDAIVELGNYILSEVHDWNFQRAKRLLNHYE